MTQAQLAEIRVDTDAVDALMMWQGGVGLSSDSKVTWVENILTSKSLPHQSEILMNVLQHPSMHSAMTPDLFASNLPPVDVIVRVLELWSPNEVGYQKAWVPTR